MGRFWLAFSGEVGRLQEPTPARMLIHIYIRIFMYPCVCIYTYKYSKSKRDWSWEDFLKCIKIFPLLKSWNWVPLPLLSVPLAYFQMTWDQNPRMEISGVCHIYIKCLKSFLMSSPISPWHFLCLVMQTGRALCHCVGDTPCERQGVSKVGSRS